MFQIYKPNKAGSGHAFGIRLIDGAFLVTMLKQSGPLSQKGSFNNSRKQLGKEVFVKLNKIEASGILDALKNNYEWNVIHNFKDKITKIRFSPWIEKGKVEGEDTQKGYSFVITTPGINNTSTSFVIGFNFAEARLLEIGLETGIRKVIMDAILKDEAYANNKNQNIQNETNPAVEEPTQNNENPPEPDPSDINPSQESDVNF